MNLRSVTSLMLIVMSTTLLFQFGVIVVYGRFYIYETNGLILALEILALLLATGVGIANLIKETK